MDNFDDDMQFYHNFSTLSAIDYEALIGGGASQQCPIQQIWGITTYPDHIFRTQFKDCRRYAHIERRLYGTHLHNGKIEDNYTRKERWLLDINYNECNRLDKVIETTFNIYDEISGCVYKRRAAWALFVMDREYDELIEICRKKDKKEIDKIDNKIDKLYKTLREKYNDGCPSL
jgi:hypothetical protein